MTTKPAIQTDSLHLRRIPADVKRRFKAWCAANNTNMTKQLIQLMKEASRESGNVTQGTSRSNRSGKS
jgi:hypothetical protein